TVFGTGSGGLGHQTSPLAATFRGNSAGSLTGPTEKVLEGANKGFASGSNLPRYFDNPANSAKRSRPARGGLGTGPWGYSAPMVDDLRKGAERAKEAMGERASAARDAVGERATAAKEAVGERAIAAREATADALAAVKPKLRGVTHEWAFFLSLGFGAALIILAKTPKATLAVAIY